MSNNSNSHHDVETPAWAAPPGQCESRFEDEPTPPPVTSKNHHLYFLGCCCDFRRAVLAFNFLWFLLHTIVMVIYIFMFVERNKILAEAGIDDDIIVEIRENFPIIEFAVMCAVSGMAILCSAIGIFGALTFKRWAIKASKWYYVLGSALYTILVGWGITFLVNNPLNEITGDLATDIVLIWAGCTFHLLSFYAHTMMQKLIEEGIMVKENYRNIAGCCGKFYH